MCAPLSMKKLRLPSLAPMSATMRLPATSIMTSCSLLLAVAVAGMDMLMLPVDGLGKSFLQDEYWGSHRPKEPPFLTCPMWGCKKLHLPPSLQKEGMHVWCLKPNSSIPPQDINTCSFPSESTGILCCAHSFPGEDPFLRERRKKFLHTPHFFASFIASSQQLINPPKHFRGRLVLLVLKRSLLGHTIASRELLE